MTEKRYEKRMNFNINLPDNRCFKTEEGIVDKKEDEYEALSINDIVYRLNALHEENEQLKLKIDGLEYALRNIKKIDVEIDLE